MATNLKNLKINKVDFVDDGANPDANIILFKSKEGKVKNNVVTEKDNTGVIRKFLAFIAKAAGAEQDELESVIDEIKKGNSVSFKEKLNEQKNRKISDEIWDICYALQNSICSILNDDELDADSTSDAMQQSLDDFYNVVKESIAKWSNGKEASIVVKKEEVTEAELEVMKFARDRLSETIEKAVVINKETNNIKTPKGDRDMKIDKSKLTPVERAFLEDIEKRCGEGEVDDNISQNVSSGTGAGSDVTKSAQHQSEPVQTQNQNGEDVVKSSVKPEGVEKDDIYKGIHPAVKAEIEQLRKFREEAEDREIRDVAKRYAIIGKKEDDLFPVLKNLKAAGGTAYNDMIAVLDQAVETVEKSGAFSEIGKSGGNAGEVGAAWAKAEAQAVELMKSKTGITKAQALDEVLQNDLELAKQCEKEG